MCGGGVIFICLPTAHTPAAPYLGGRFILSRACRNSTTCCGTPVLHQQNKQQKNNQRDASDTRLHVKQWYWLSHVGFSNQHTSAPDLQRYTQLIGRCISHRYDITKIRQKQTLEESQHLNSNTFLFPSMWQTKRMKPKACVRDTSAGWTVIGWDVMDGCVHSLASLV